MKASNEIQIPHHMLQREDFSRWDKALRGLDKPQRRLIAKKAIGMAHDLYKQNVLDGADPAKRDFRLAFFSYVNAASIAFKFVSKDSRLKHGFDDAAGLDDIASMQQTIAQVRDRKQGKQGFESWDRCEKQFSEMVQDEDFVWFMQELHAALRYSSVEKFETLWAQRAAMKQSDVIFDGLPEEDQPERTIQLQEPDF